MQRRVYKRKKNNFFILTMGATAVSVVALFVMLAACVGGDVAETTETEVTTHETTVTAAETTEVTFVETTEVVTTAETTAEPLLLYDADLANYPEDSPEYELYRLFAEDIPQVEEIVAVTAIGEDGSIAAVTVVDDAGNITEVTESEWRDGKAAIYYKDIASGKTVAVNGDKVFSAASMIKAVYVYTLLISADNGEIDLDEEIVYNETMFVDGTGRFKDVESGSIFTIRQLISFTMRYSDNTAYSMLRNRFGTKYFTPAMEAVGISATKYSKWWSATAVQYGEFFAVLAEYFISESENAKWLKSEMINSTQTVMLQNAFAPDTVAHKYGWDKDSYCDGGVVFASDGTYAVVFMSDLDSGHYRRANTQFIYAVGDALKALRGGDATEEVTE